MRSKLHPRASLDERGVTLLMGLLVLATVTGIALAVSALVVRDVLQSRNLDNAITAYYAADVGIEQALLKIKTERVEGIPQETGTQFEDLLDDLEAISGNLGDANYSVRDVEEGPDFHVANILKDDSTQVDLFEPDICDFGTDQPEVNAIQTNWTSASGPSAWIEVLAERFYLCETVIFVTPPSVTEAVPSETKSFILPCRDDPTGCVVGAPCQCDEDRITELGWSGSGGFRFKVKALYDDVTNLTLQPGVYEDNVFTPVTNLRNRVVFTAEGNANGSRVAISTSVPWRLPSANIFDFVLFSEETLSLTRNR